MEEVMNARTDASIRNLARIGLSHRVRPGRLVGDSVATDLFAVEEDVQRRNNALVLLMATFEATDPKVLSTADRRTYRRSVQRRRKLIEAAAASRDRLLEAYGRELLSERVDDPRLQAAYESAWHKDVR